MLVTVIAQFAAKSTNSEKAIYFLSLMFWSINKLKSHIFFTCKNFMVSDFTWKKGFAPGILLFSLRLWLGAQRCNNFLPIKTKYYAVLPIFTTTKCWCSAYRYDLASGSMIVFFFFALDVLLNYSAGVSLNWRLLNQE